MTFEDTIPLKLIPAPAVHEHESCQYVMSNAYVASFELTWAIEDDISFDLRKARLVVGPHRRLLLIVPELVDLHFMRMK